MLLWVSVTNEKKQSKMKQKVELADQKPSKKDMPRVTSVTSLENEGRVNDMALPAYVLVGVAPAVCVVVAEVPVLSVPELEAADTVDGVVVVVDVPLRAAKPIRFWS